MFLPRFKISASVCRVFYWNTLSESQWRLFLSTLAQIVQLFRAPSRHKPIVNTQPRRFYSDGKCHYFLRGDFESIRGYIILFSTKSFIKTDAILGPLLLKVWGINITIWARFISTEKQTKTVVKGISNKVTPSKH